MTVLIGILCEDGVVVAADGAATLGSPGRPSVRQPVRKLSVVDGCAIFGLSGPVGLSQRLGAVFEDLCTNKAFTSKGGKPLFRCDDAMGLLRTEFFKVVAGELQAAQVAQPVIGHQAAQSTAISSALVALPVNKQACLIQFNEQCAPEAASAHLRFVCLGSGQTNADVFLAFLREMFWKETAPKVADGIFAAVWTLEHVIRTAPGFVAEPMQVAVLQKVDDKWVARELTDPELVDTRQAVTAAETHVRNYRAAPPPPAPPPPPPPPAAAPPAERS